MVKGNYSSVSCTTSRACPRECAFEGVRPAVFREGEREGLDVVLDRVGIVWRRPNGDPLYGLSFSIASAFSLSLVERGVRRGSAVVSCTDPLGATGFGGVCTGDGVALRSPAPLPDP